MKTWIEKMFSGEKINSTENRAVLHTALRSKESSPLMVDDENIRGNVKNVLNRMKTFSDNVREGEWKGYTGKKIKDIVNIGKSYQPISWLRLKAIILSVIIMKF